MTNSDLPRYTTKQREIGSFYCPLLMLLTVPLYVVFLFVVAKISSTQNISWTLLKSFISLALPDNFSPPHDTNCNA